MASLNLSSNSGTSLISYKPLQTATTAIEGGHDAPLEPSNARLFAWAFLVCAVYSSCRVITVAVHVIRLGETGVEWGLLASLNATWPLFWALLFVPLYRLLGLALRRFRRWWLPVFWVCGFGVWVVSSALVALYLESLFRGQPLPGLAAMYSKSSDYIFSMEVFFGYFSAVFFASYQQYKVRVIKNRQAILATERESALRSTERNQSQLEALHHGLSAHFLFNSLNTVSAFARNNDCDAAADISSRLRDLLLYATEASHSLEVELEREIAFSKAYVELQQRRFEDKFDIAFTEDIEDQNPTCPPFALQTLVENAFSHSDVTGGEPARVQVDITARQGKVCIRAINWPVSTTKDSGGLGTGISNLQQRLRLIYADKATLEHGLRGDVYAVEMAISYAERGLDRVETS